MINDRENSRKNFLIALGTTALAGCASAGGLVPIRKPESICGPQPLSVRRTETTCVGGGGGGVPSNLSGMTIAQLQAISAEQIYDLDAGQIGSVTDDQLGAFTAAQCAVFHPYQASAIFERVAAAQSGAPGSLPPGPPPPEWTPAHPGSAFWGWFAGVVGGYAGGAIVGTVIPVVGYPIGSIGGSTALGLLMGSGNDMTFNFWNSNTGQYNSIDVMSYAQQSSMMSADPQGYYLDGSFDASSNTVTITVIGN